MVGPLLTRITREQFLRVRASQRPCSEYRATGKLLAGRAHYEQLRQAVVSLMVFTFFGVMTTRAAQKGMNSAAPSTVPSPLSRASYASSSAATTVSPSVTADGAGTPRTAREDSDAKDTRLAMDIAQLMQTDSNYSPKDIADFLHQLPHLDPKMVGRVLGEPDALALNVLQEYANGFVFKDFPFDVSLRVYLGRFALPGEAQKIDRILQAFAKAYYIANPRDKICTSEDAVYTLAFSIVLLNTDAHNPHLAKKYKMTKEDFLRNHQRLIVDGKNMPQDYLARCFDSFASYPIQLIPRKPTEILDDELELTFSDGPLGLEIETSIDGRTCVVKRYATPHRHIYCSLDANAASSDPPKPLPDLGGYVIVAVADDCTRAVGYALTRYLLKTAARPVTVRFCEPSIYFASLAT